MRTENEMRRPILSEAVGGPVHDLSRCDVLGGLAGSPGGLANVEVKSNDGPVWLALTGPAEAKKMIGSFLAAAGRTR